MTVPVSVVIPVKNEEANLPGCLDHLRWAGEVFVVDSRSTDRTANIAAEAGARVVQFDWDGGWPKKKGWAIATLPLSHDWVFLVDADEHVTPPLAEEIGRVVSGPRDGGGPVAYYVNRRFMFLGRWIRHCGYYPSWNLRLFRRGHARFERVTSAEDTRSGDNEVHEHLLADGPVGWLTQDLLHYAYPTLDAFVEKHLRYSRWEAYARLERDAGAMRGRLCGTPLERRRWLKRLAARLPFRPTLRFLYSYVLRGGFLDGYEGWVFCRLLAWYELISDVRTRELRERRRSSPPVP